jgi:hypothetical protein
MESTGGQCVFNPGDRLLRGAMESIGGQFGYVGISGGLLLLQRVRVEDKHYLREGREKGRGRERERRGILHM